MENKKIIKVVFFQRKPLNTNFSLEYFFQCLRKKLEPPFVSELFINKFFSKGLVGRLYNVAEAALNQGNINHITGDIHYIAIFFRRERTILTILDCVFMIRPPGILRNILKLFWLTIPIRSARYVTAISESTKREIIKYTSCDENLIRVIPITISRSFYYFPKEFNSKCPILLHIGMSPNKNLCRVIEAVAGLKIKMNIIGELSSGLIKRLDELNISYTNNWGLSSDAMVEEYRRCDMLVFASTYEGFGMPILEAQATGRPVVTSNLSSMPEVAGHGACFVDPFQIESIRHGITKIISEKSYRDKLIELGLDNVKRFDEDIIAKMYVNLYQEVASKS